MSILIRPRIPPGQGPTGDDDPTGVRDLLSSLPEPDPMPDHLVERINASLAAEQAQRATGIANGTVTPLLATRGRRPTRRVLAIAGAAAAVAMVAALGSNLLSVHQPSSSSDSAAVASRPRAGEATGGGLSGAAAKARAPKALDGPATGPSSVQIGLSGIRYTRADFVTQAQTLRRVSLPPIADRSSSAGPAGTTAGLMECLTAIGAVQAQVVRADVAFYEGRPAVIIVATTNGTPVAYAVGRQCSQSDAAMLRPATPLP